MKTEDIIKKIPELKLVPKPKKPIITRYYYPDRGWIAYNILEGKETADTGRCYSVYVGCGKRPDNRIEGIYYEYISEIESIACMLCSLDIRRPPKDILRSWKVEDVFFITEHKELITKFGDEWIVITEDLDKYLPFSILKYGIDDYRPYEYYEDHVDNIQEAFSYLFPVAYLKASKAVVIDRPTVILDFLAHKEQKKRTGPKQTLIDELTKIKLPNVELPNEGSLTKVYSAGHGQNDTFVKISKVKENVCCLRYFTKHLDSNISYENVRIYVDGKTFIGCKKNNQNEYVQFKLSAGKNNFTSGSILPFEKDDLNGTTLQYFGTIFDEIPKEKQSMFIWMFLQYPLMEKLYRLGLKKLVLESAGTWSANPTEGLTKLFGEINPKQKNVNKCLGINKYQFNKYLEVADTKEANRIIAVIKEILRTSNIDYLDNTTFDTMFDELTSFLTTSHYHRIVTVSLANLNELYSTKTMLNLLPELIKMTKASDTSWHSSTNYIGYYHDYLDTVKKLGDTKHFRPNFDSYNDIKDMHDAAVAVYNLKREEYRLEAFKKQAKKWESFVYNGEKFSVIAPKHPGEVANEGIVLHHCVKSYIDRITSGATNIVFIRKTNELEKPFFTVEVSNLGKIEQVHGFGNRNADTEPGLEDFVEEWAKACKLKTNNFNKVR